jgi:hypothetical protein
MATLLDGVRAKLDRTGPQIRELAVLIETFFQSWPVGHVSNYDPELDEDVWSFAIGSPVLPQIPVLIGEVLHNVRSPLDQMASAIAKKNTGSYRNTYFPFGADQASFEEQVQQKCKRLPTDVVDRIRAWKPYRGGNDSLWLAHDLNRDDKHNNLTPVNLSTGVNRTTYFDGRASPGGIRPGAPPLCPLHARG